MPRCVACDCDTDLMFSWKMADELVKLPAPPTTLYGSLLCQECYYSGNVDRLIKNKYRVVAPDGTDGMMCGICKEYNPYVEANRDDGSYICFKHRREL